VLGEERPVKGGVRRVRRILPGLLLVPAAAAAACSSSDQPAAEPTPSAPTSTTTSPSATPTLPRATPAPVPPKHGCYRLTYRTAVAPTTRRAPVDCSKTHTSATYAVGELDTVVDGHLLAVDSKRVQAQAGQECPDRFASYVGGSLDDRRLTMLRPVWFTPTVAQSDAGARWYRCDAVAIAGDERLAPLTGSLAGVLDRATGRDVYGMCGTSEPAPRASSG
jgi:hypothetical protein